MLKDNVPKLQAFIVIIGVVIGGVYLGLREESASNKQPSHNDSPSQEKEDDPFKQVSLQRTGPQKWYEGGTLHKASMKEWNRATYENKVATAADLVVAMLESDGLSVDSETELKLRAVDLTLGLDNASRDGIIDHWTVAETAAAIGVLMDAD